MNEAAAKLTITTCLGDASVTEAVEIPLTAGTLDFTINLLRALFTVFPGRDALLNGLRERGEGGADGVPGILDGHGDKLQPAGMFSAGNPDAVSSGGEAIESLVHVSEPPIEHVSKEGHGFGEGVCVGCGGHVGKWKTGDRVQARIAGTSKSCEGVIEALAGTQVWIRQGDNTLWETTVDRLRLTMPAALLVSLKGPAEKPSTGGDN